MRFYRLDYSFMQKHRMLTPLNQIDSPLSAFYPKYLIQELNYFVLITYFNITFSFTLHVCLQRPTVGSTARGHELHMCHILLEELILSPVLTSSQCQHLFPFPPTHPPMGKSHSLTDLHSNAQLNSARRAAHTGHHAGHFISVMFWQLLYIQHLVRKWIWKTLTIKKYATL